MNTAMVVSWRSVVPGRESRALQYAQEVASFWEKAAADGKCTPPETFLSRTGKSLWIVKGDFDTLRQLQESSEARRLEAQGMLLLTEFTVEAMLAGDAGTEYMTKFGSVAAELGYA